MDKLKFGLFSVVVLALVGVLGYWAVATIQSGTEHSKSATIKQLEEENADLKQEVDRLTSELGVFLAEEETNLAIAEEQAAEEAKPKPEVYKHQSLIDDLQKLVKDNILMKEKSRGTRVGTVQEFLNIYNNTSKRVDNDYGPGTVAGVKAFQKDEGITADGETGPNTYNKMVDWLKEQG